MAIMVPSIPNNFVPASREGEIFNSLKRLPNDYYVFHSLRIIKIKNNEWIENEIDFVVFNKEKGIICLEAKAGQVQCVDGVWYYGSGKEMRDPFTQAYNNKWNLHNKIGDFPQFRGILSRCKIMSAVWFPSLTREKLNEMILPIHALKDIVLTMDDMENPLSSIEKILSIQTRDRSIPVVHSLTDFEAAKLIQDIFCPSFNILPSKTLELDYKREKFNALIDEQFRLLNYLEDQRSAVINGAAGTGKTMIAVEKARRHSVNGEKVLFLCFNKQLKIHLERTYKYSNVEYYTIDGLACKVCESAVANFELLEEKLFSMYEDKSFPYQHVIVDEGQDFGQERIENNSILQLLEDIVLSMQDGTFFVFYDKLQLIQSNEVPKFIEDADCRLTLYKNCRNTKRIAETSFKPLSKKPKLFDGAMSGINPEIAFVDEHSMKAKLDFLINKVLSNKYSDIQILSCAAEGRSLLQQYVKDGDYVSPSGRIKFTTCRKFKGLEADVVILIDVDKKAFLDNSKLFYVGASRARFELNILASLTDEDCIKLLNDLNSVVKRNDPKGSFAKLIGCKQV